MHLSIQSPTPPLPVRGGICTINSAKGWTKYIYNAPTPTTMGNIGNLYIYVAYIHSCNCHGLSFANSQTQLNLKFPEKYVQLKKKHPWGTEFPQRIHKSSPMPGRSEEEWGLTMIGALYMYIHNLMSVRS